MAKLSVKKLKEYKETKENGFIIDLYKVLHPFSFGDEYPQFTKTVYTNETEDKSIKIYLTVSFFKYYDKRTEYRIKASEFVFDKDSDWGMGGTGKFAKTYHKEDGGRFSFKYLKEMCNKFDMADIEKQILKDYEDYKNNKVVA